MLQCNWVNKPRGPSTKTSLAFNLYWFSLSVWGVVIYNCLILFTIIGKNFKGGSFEFNIRLRKSPNNIDFSWVLLEPRHLLWSPRFTGHNALTGISSEGHLQLKICCSLLMSEDVSLVQGPKYLHHLLFSLYWHGEACIDNKGLHILQFPLQTTEPNNFHPAK